MLLLYTPEGRALLMGVSEGESRNEVLRYGNTSSTRCTSRVGPWYTPGWTTVAVRETMRGVYKGSMALLLVNQFGSNSEGTAFSVGGCTWTRNRGYAVAVSSRLSFLCAATRERSTRANDTVL